MRRQAEVYEATLQRQMEMAAKLQVRDDPCHRRIAAKLPRTRVSQEEVKNEKRARAHMETFLSPHSKQAALRSIAAPSPTPSRPHREHTIQVAASSEWGKAAAAALEDESEPTQVANPLVSHHSGD